MAQLILRPNGTISQELFGHPTGTNHENIDEEVTDDYTSYVFNSGEDFGSRDDYYTLPDTDITTGYINNVRLYSRWYGTYQYGFPNNCAIISEFITVGDIYSLYGSTHKGVGDVWQTSYIDWALNPKTNLPWTWSDINSLGLSISISVYRYYPTVGAVTQLYIVIDYAPSAWTYIYPTGMGYYDQLWKYPDTGNKWDKLIDASDSTFVYHPWEGYLEPDSYTMTQVNGSGIIQNVRLCARGKDDNTYAGNLQAFVRTHSLDYTVITSPTAYYPYNYAANMFTNPYTGVEWTWQEINDLQFGLRSKSSKGWYELYGIVEYIPAASRKRQMFIKF